MSELYTTVSIDEDGGDKYIRFEYGRIYFACYYMFNSVTKVTYSNGGDEVDLYKSRIKKELDDCKFDEVLNKYKKLKDTVVALCSHCNDHKITSLACSLYSDFADLDE